MNISSRYSIYGLHCSAHTLFAHAPKRTCNVLAHAHLEGLVWWLRHLRGRFNFNYSEIRISISPVLVTYFSEYMSKTAMNGSEPSNRQATTVLGDTDAILGDVDMIELLSGCMESQEDIQELVEGLTEMDDELQAMIEDDSFLQFPGKLPQSRAHYVKCLLSEVYRVLCNGSIIAVLRDTHIANIILI